MFQRNLVSRRSSAVAAVAFLWLCAPHPLMAQSGVRDRDAEPPRERGRGEPEGEWEIGPDGKARPRQPGVRLIEPPQRQAGDWRFGVVTEDVQTGCLVRDVLPGTAAYRAGLERGDIIVAVEGYQVGWVNGRLYDLGDELHVRGGRSGRVRMLIQNQRDKALINLEVQLDRAPDPRAPAEYALIQGTVSYRERIALPPRAVLVVRLVKVPRLGGEPVLLAQRSYSQPGQPPIPFELRYPFSAIDRGTRYEVQAEITVDGRPWFVQDGAYPCITGGHPTDVQILLRRYGE